MIGQLQDPHVPWFGIAQWKIMFFNGYHWSKWPYTWKIMVSLGKRYTNHWLFTMLVKLLVGTVKIIELKGASISWEKNRASDVYSKTVRRNLVGPEMPPGVPIAIYIYILSNNQRLVLVVNMWSACRLIEFNSTSPATCSALNDTTTFHNHVSLHKPFYIPIVDRLLPINPQYSSVMTPIQNIEENNIPFTKLRRQISHSSSTSFWRLVGRFDRVPSSTECAYQLICSHIFCSGLKFLNHH